MILRGDRNLTPAHVRKLAAHFTNQAPEEWAKNIDRPIHTRGCAAVGCQAAVLSDAD